MMGNVDRSEGHERRVRRALFEELLRVGDRSSSVLVYWQEGERLHSASVETMPDLENRPGNWWHPVIGFSPEWVYIYHEDGMNTQHITAIPRHPELVEEFKSIPDL